MQITISGKLRLEGGSARDLRMAVLRGWVAQLNMRLQSRIAGVLAGIREAVKDALLSSDEIAKLFPGGSYHSEFGMPDIKDRWNAIVEKLVESIQVRLSPFAYNGRVIAGKVMVYGLPVSCSEILRMSEGTLMSENGQAFQWLAALLTQGDAIVVQNYKYMSDKLSPASKAKSRTKEGLMIELAGRGWRIPSDISGTLSDNLITRVLASDKVKRIVQAELESLLW